MKFDNRFVRELPGEPTAAPGARPVRGALYSRVQPTPVAAPRWIAVNQALAAEIDAEPDSPAFLQAMAGNHLLPGMEPIASNYGGHQFGHWAGQLGDGRAISLGEAIGRDGARYELQLKGAGPTPYSRHADGRAVLRSSLREYVLSEAMYALGVPTTRALSLVATGEPVVRDMFYDGRPQQEPGAIVCRVAPSFIRFGHFELPAARGDTALLERLIDFTLDRDFPQLRGDRSRWFVEIAERTARLMVDWMRLGFVHGVMNTDNFSILGLTIDYGPFGWLENVDPLWTPNTTDAEGRRYAYGRQPQIAQWNLSALAHALTSMVDGDALAAGLDHYGNTFSAGYLAAMRNKLGLADAHDDDLDLVRELMAWMEAAECDFTLTFRALSDSRPGDLSARHFEALSYNVQKFSRAQSRIESWLSRYAQRGDAPDRKVRMDGANPRIVPRNYLLQQAIDAAEQGDLGVLNELLKALERPFADQPQFEHLAAKRPEWARSRAGCSMLSCSS